MNRIITLFLFLVLGSSIANAQKSSVEESLFGVQTGFLGIWGYNELRLADQLTLRSEIGFNAGIWGGSSYSNTFNYIFTPTITIEPRWYYNLKKRADKGRRTWNNGANFLSLETSLHPDLFTISNHDNVAVTNTIAFIPKWGIKRNIGQHFGFEIAVGPLGYRINLDDTRNSGTTATLDLKIGYNF
ncbi:hypothetical protein [Zunongwangia endophytica]|uniref:Outer membrane protein beta-barrel domain-containing protein n=1 Tax=Zunongwangia endophytica TaxID=1808945 RepID=A0ABV8H4U7_9FLAO|nr:hypothetical protein [Zunongwangia endophytica]MDN3596569.1 hypothetical protein [Zunongwangia endophytica]